MCAPTYRLILNLLGLAALERYAMTLVLQALRSDQALDARSLRVGLLALALGLDLTPNDVLADLLFREYYISLRYFSAQTLPELRDVNRRSSRAGDDGI